MMPDIIVQPKPAQVPAKGSSGSRMVKSAMQKAASQGDTTTQTVSPGAAAQKKVPVEKSGEQPVSFMDLLMAQIEGPAEAVVLPSQMAESVNVDAAQPLQTETEITALSLDTATDSSTHVVIQQPLTSTTPSASQVIVQASAAEVKPVLPGAEAPEPQAKPVTLTPQNQSEMPAATLPKAQQSGSTPEQAQSGNAVTVAAQTLAAPTVKNASQDSGDMSQLAPKAPQRAPNVVVVAPDSIATAAEKVTNLAQTLAARMASKTTTKPTTNTPHAGLSREAASPITQITNSDSAALLHSSQAGVTSIRHDLPVNPSASVQTAAPQTASEAGANLRFLANQVAEGVRSAVGSDRTLTISLNPPELGRVFIRLQEDNGSVNAVLRVENPVTRADIEQALPSIVRSLEQSGIQVRRMDVQPSDPVPQQEGSFNRQYDMHGGMPNQRDPHNNPSTQSSSSGGNSWQNLQPAVASATPVSTVSDSAINIYM